MVASGETQEEYAASEAFVRDELCPNPVFVYSPRPGTPAALMPQVDKKPLKEPN